MTGNRIFQVTGARIDASVLTILCFAVLVAGLGASPAKDNAAKATVADKEKKELAGLLKTLINEKNTETQQGTDKRFQVKQSKKVEKAATEQRDNIPNPGQNDDDDDIEQDALIDTEQRDNIPDPGEQDIPIDTEQRDNIPDPGEQDIPIDTEQRDNIPDEADEDAPVDTEQRDLHVGDDGEGGANEDGDDTLAMDERASYSARYCTDHSLCRYISTRNCRSSAVKNYCKKRCRNCARPTPRPPTYSWRNIYLGPSVRSSSRNYDRYSATYILSSYKAPADGLIRYWQFYARRPGTIYLQVWRPLTLSNSRRYKLVGQRAYRVSRRGFRTVSGGSIKIRRNDVIGFASLEIRTLRGTIIPWTTSSCRNTLYRRGVSKTIRGIRYFSNRGCRLYSLRASIGVKYRRG